MRSNTYTRWSFWTACASLIPTICAVPSPPRLITQDGLAQHFDAGRPAWRSLSDTLISKIWATNEAAPGTFRPKETQWDDSRIHTKSRYGDDLLLRFNISTSEEAASLSAVADFMYLDVWEYNKDWADIRIAKDVLPHVLKTLPASMQHSHTALLQEKELAQAIYDTYPSSQRSAPSPRPITAHSKTNSHSGPDSDVNVFFTDYQPLSVIQPWLRLLASLFTTHVRLLNIGISYEGRDIPALKVGVHPTNNAEPSPRKTVLITGGLHAREWISTSTVNYIAYSLITGYGKDTLITKLLEDFDWVFVPTLNPDGYVYSWETDRLWRKNRQATAAHYCHGMDLDRSFDFEWDGASTKGNPCSESFSGDGPFQGVESKALADWAKNETENNNVELVGFLDLHSYSQQILYPYSYSCDAVPPSLENLQELAAGLAKAIRLNHGHAFQAAQACEGNVGVADETTAKQRQVYPRFESGGGSALDWFYHELKVHYTYQIKLRDRGSYGFLLPREHIVPSGKEMVDAIIYFGKYLSSQFELSQKGVDLTQDQVPEEAVVADTVAGILAEEAEEAFRDAAAPAGAGSEKSVNDDDESVYWELRRRRRV